MDHQALTIFAGSDSEFRRVIKFELNPGACGRIHYVYRYVADQVGWRGPVHLAGLPLAFGEAAHDIEK